MAMQKQELGLKLKAPKKFWDRDLTANYKALAKALTKTGKNAIAGNYPAVVADAVEGVLEGLGLKSNDTGEIAWLLIHRAFLRSLYELIVEHKEFIQELPEDPQSLDKAMQLTPILSEVYIDRSFLQRPDDLVVMDKIKQSFSTWLHLHGTDKIDPVSITMELPPRFHRSLDIEWSRRPGEYKPLKDAFNTPFVAPPPDIAELRNAYVTYLRESYQSLDLKGIPGVLDAVRKAAGIELESIFVPLKFRDDFSSGEASLSRDKSMKTLNWNTEKINALVVLGDPGSGKSTLLKQRTLQLVNKKSGVLPIIIPLNAYADALESERIPLRSYFSDYFAGRQHRLAGLRPLFEHYMQAGRAVFLLDGLDEVQTERSVVVGLVEDFVREVQPLPAVRQSIAAVAGNEVIVTSRFVGYQEAPLTDRRWRTTELVDWGKEEIAQFVERWTYAVERAIAGGEENETVRIKAETERKELQEAILSNESITRLAGNPLLLTILALIKRQGVTLPDRRVELYELYLRTLLESWGQIRALDDSPVGPKGDYYALVQVLAPLALWLREENPQGGLIHRELLMKFLTDYYTEEYGLNKAKSYEESKAFLEAVHRYSSLLLEKGHDQFGFIHLTFEEYLAGKGLARLSSDEAAKIILKYFPDDRWHETILLGFGALGLVSQQPNQAGQLLDRVLQKHLPGKQRGANEIFALKVLQDVGNQGVGRRAAQRVIRALGNTMQDPEAMHQCRREAGLHLGKHGWLPDDLEAFVEVPPGKFLFGDKKQELEISYHYWIGKYPVTNSQYARFIEAEGYESEGYWDSSGLQWVNANKITLPNYWKDEDRNNPIFPIVGISWYEAHAYCRWLVVQLREQGIVTDNGNFSFPEKCTVNLAKEMEWERAARGIDGRKYPWGNEFLYANLNSSESGLKETTAACTYPQGKSPTNAWDMSGNTLEWCDTSSGRCVLRGGAFSDFRLNVRCAYRNSGVPDRRYGNVGFRVVLSPFSLTKE